MYAGVPITAPNCVVAFADSWTHIGGFRQAEVSTLAVPWG